MCARVPFVLYTVCEVLGVILRVVVRGVVLVVCCVVLFLCVCVCDLFLFLQTVCISRTVYTQRAHEHTMQHRELIREWL